MGRTSVKLRGRRGGAHESAQCAAVEVIGMNEAARTLVDRVGKHDKSYLPGAAAPCRR